MKDILMKYAFWIPLYEDTQEEMKIVKRIVLRRFKAFILDFYRQGYNFVRVKNFSIIDNMSNSINPLDEEEFGKRTYGWKVDVTCSKVSHE